MSAEIGGMFSVRLLCIQTLHKIHMGLLVVVSEGRGGVRETERLIWWG